MKRIRLRIKMVFLIGWLFILVCFSHSIQAQSQLQIGLAQVEMQFPTGIPMWGYLPARPSTGTLDPLYARIFYFQEGDQNVALVQLDLGRTFGDAQMNRVRAEVEEKAGIQEVIFTATHTHSGPYVHDEYPNGEPPDWELKVLDDIAIGIIQASQNVFEAQLGYGSGNSYIGFNRRYVRNDGSVKMLWANPTKISTYPVDPEVQVLRIDDLSGKTRAVIVGHACHPVVFGPDNQQYSADFPGTMAQYVSDKLSDAPMVSFFQGGCGDINPYMDKRRIRENGIALKDQVGLELGEEVLRVTKTIATHKPEPNALNLALDTLYFADKLDASKSYQAILTVLLLDGVSCFLGYPGEPFVEFQMEWKRQAGMPAFFMGYTNGYLRYFPTIRATVEGGYGARGPVVVLETGAGERLLHRGLNLLYHLTGKLSMKTQR